MKLHRFYLSDTDLTQNFWLKDSALYHQWSKVLRFEIGREVALFNAQQHERLYRIVKFGDNAVQLELITEMEPKAPKNEIYLCFSLLKKDKNDWVLQKCTELGVSHFIPIISERTEKTGFDVERAEKIVVEASEQCGRTDIPRVREPISLEKVIEELSEKVEIFVAEQGSPEMSNIESLKSKAVAVLVGPEGGWTDNEKQLFKDKNLKHLALSEFTLRAETACVTASALLQ
jgi:16S rRNA (uracil1498-N3)-methyltransferase